MNKRLKEAITNSRFCYAKDGGQGFVLKEDCACGNKCCEEYKDQEKFRGYLKDMEYGDYKKRAEIIEKIKPEFKDSKWWKDNVVE